MMSIMISDDERASRLLGPLSAIPEAKALRQDLLALIGSEHTGALLGAIHRAEALLEINARR